MSPIKRLGYIAGFFCALVHFVQTAVPDVSICSEQEHHLTGSGYNSAVYLRLESADDSDGPCKLKVTAPDSHIVSVSFAPASATSGTHVAAKPSSPTLQNPNTTCMISIYLPENRRTAVWKVDPCQGGPDSLPPARLLTPHLRVVWTPPKHEVSDLPRLVLTAIGKGSTCQQEGQHTCWRLGWTPLMCVASELACDGVAHCPRDEADELAVLCSPGAFHVHQRGPARIAPPWEQLARELMERFSYRSNDVPGWLQRTRIHHTPPTPKPTPVTTPVPGEGVTAALAHYGPWGYLMLGMLVCGTVLMFCGLWECCCRSPKVSPPSHSGVTLPVLVTDSQNSTMSPAIVVISENEDINPPSYEDLDQPPSYNVLFPTAAKDADGLILNPGRLICNEQPPPDFHTLEQSVAVTPHRNVALYTARPSEENNNALVVSEQNNNNDNNNYNASVIVTNNTS